MRSALLTPELVARYTAAGMWEGRLVDTDLERWAREYPERVALVDGNGSWTYGALDDRINRAAQALRTRGIGRGDVVSWQLPNWVESVVVHHAALRLGAVSNPIIPIYRSSEVSFILAQARSRVVVVPEVFRGFDFPRMVEEMRGSLPDLEHVLVVGAADPAHGESFDAAVADAPAERVQEVRDADDVCLLLYTSGTTADPKGALHTHNTLDYENRSIIRFFGLTSDDVVFMPSPVAHITGVLYGLQLPFVLGASVVFQDVWEAGRALALVEQWRCSFVLAATPFLHGLVNHADLATTDVSSLRVFACGGADVPPALVTSATELLSCHVARVYGSTEFPTATCSGPGDPLSERAHTDGRAIGWAEIRIVDQDGGEVVPGEVGEVLLRGPDLFLGYLDAALNADCLDRDGWFASGDLGTLRDGFLTITGRKKDIIIRGGENISAKEVEDLLFGHPDIADVAVVGYPDPVLVERVAAVVVVRVEREVDQASVSEWLQRHGIAKQKIPDRLFRTGELPRTASGKIQKFKLREYVRSLLDDAAAVDAVAEPAASRG